MDSRFTFTFLTRYTAAWMSTLCAISDRLDYSISSANLIFNRLVSVDLVKFENVLPIALGGMSDRDNYGLNYVYTIWCVYLKLELLPSYTMNCYTIVEYRRGSSSTVSVLP